MVLSRCIYWLLKVDLVRLALSFDVLLIEIGGVFKYQSNLYSWGFVTKFLVNEIVQVVPSVESEHVIQGPS
ncbi:hypothetical protein PGTUg99_035638 [Puccinia graminis f. sp. tritici]|uniref:Uncharacterized protein n=1 Tax=Puccinia graminis f. sp. tritici TaxID=56615 RepID=A0A5B0RNE3_PUCGR|nr:hypothetical protein PGTUg99_035638 [Puccinia graminis f. sp. tritici]